MYSSLSRVVKNVGVRRPISIFRSEYQWRDEFNIGPGKYPCELKK